MDSSCIRSSLPIAGEERSFIEIFEEKKLVQPLRVRTDLINILGYVSLMSQVTVAALEAVEKYEWRKFDALVRECACHLRAAKIKDLADLILFCEHWQQEISKTKQLAQEILCQLPIVKQQIEETIHSNLDFKATYGASIPASFACKQWNILQRLSENMHFIVESFLLTQTKKLDKREDCFYQLSDITNAERLARFNRSLNGQTNDKKVQLIAKKKLEKLVEVMQCDLASLSIEYLKKEMTHLPASSTNQVAQEMIERGIRKDAIGRPCAPCFYSLEVLMQRIIAKQQHVLIDITRWTPNGERIERLKRLYVGDQKTNSLKCCSTSDEHPESVFVIIGNSIPKDQARLSSEEYLKLFDSYPLEEILSANWAQHAQYPGKMDLMHPLPQDERRNALAKRAEVIGCTPNDMSLFVVSHILCDRLDAALVNQELL
jgi:hypothetical protein